MDLLTEIIMWIVFILFMGASIALFASSVRRGIKDAKASKNNDGEKTVITITINKVSVKPEESENPKP